MDKKASFLSPVAQNGYVPLPSCCSSQLQTPYMGVTGRTAFDANGDTTNRVLTIYEVAPVNGQPGLVAKDVITL